MCYLSRQVGLTPYRRGVIAGSTGATPSPAGGRAEIGVRTSSGRTVMADRMATWSDSRLCIQPELAVNARLVRNLAHELSSPAPPEFDCGGRDGRPGLDAVAVDRNVDRGRGAAGGHRLHQPRIREPVLVGLGPARQRSGRGRSGRDPAGPGGRPARRRFGTVVDRPAPGAGPGGPAHLADHQPKPCNPLGGEQLRFLVKQHRPLLPADVAHPAERVDVQPVVSGLIGLGAEGESTDGPDLRQLELKNFVSQSVSCLVRPTATLWLLRGRSMG